MDVLMRYFKRNSKDVVIAILSVMVIAFASLLQPKLLQGVLSAILKDDKHQLFIIGMELIGLALLGLVAGITSAYFRAKVSQTITTDLREETYKKIQTFSYANIEEYQVGNLVVRLINDMNQINGLMQFLLGPLLRIPVVLIGSLIFALITIPRLWWIIAIMIVLVLVIAVFIFIPMGGLFGKMQRFIDRVNQIAKENLQGVRVVKSFNQQENQSDEFAKASNEMNDLNIRIGYIFSIAMPIFSLIGNLSVFVAIYMVGQSITTNPDDLAAIASFISYLMQILFAIIMGSMFMTWTSRGFVSLNRVKQILNTKTAIKYKRVPEKNLRGTVEFDNVSFRYPKASSDTLKDISFKVDSGEMIGIVGATGSGKSTLAQLIPRLFDPTKGTVKVGGVDLKDVNENSLRKAVSFVLQKAILFSGTIADNLRGRDKEAGDKEFKRAARIAQASEFVEKYADRYDHQVEERSANFSGGQKQRLSIARGVMGKPKILILDDSTSALDAKSEKLVQQAIDKDLKGTTTFIIAEKIASVINADRIFVMDDGKLVASGSHKELLKESPIYKEIYETQKAKEVN